MADFFDQNGIGSDSHYQFLNWAVDNNGAYDYAADTRGYTVGVIAEYHDRNWAFRFAEALMPKIANGPDLDWNLRRARACGSPAASDVVSPIYRCSVYQSTTRATRRGNSEQSVMS